MDIVSPDDKRYLAAFPAGGATSSQIAPAQAPISPPSPAQAPISPPSPAPTDSEMFQYWQQLRQMPPATSSQRAPAQAHIGPPSPAMRAIAGEYLAPQTKDPSTLQFAKPEEKALSFRSATVIHTIEQQVEEDFRVQSK